MNNFMNTKMRFIIDMTDKCHKNIQLLMNFYCVV